MAFSSTHQPPFLPAVKNSLPHRPSFFSVPHKDLQLRSQKRQLNIMCSLSRRDAVSSLCGALLATFLATGSAEARRVNPETKRKIKEKLDKFREKGGVQKEKKDRDTIDGDKTAASPLSSFTMPLVEANL